MKRKLYLGMIVLLALTGCGQKGSVSSTSNETPSNESSSVDEFPLRKDYVSVDKLTFAKEVSMDKVASYCEDHKSDAGWPRVRKYIYADLSYYDDEWSVMGNYSATYCYKYYNGRNYSNGNLFYMSELYILPEISKFVFEYNFYEYKTTTVGSLTVYYTYQTCVTFNFDINEKAKDVTFGGIWAYQGVKATGDIAATNSIAFLYDVKSIVPPYTLAYAADTSYQYAIKDTSKTSGITREFLNEKATQVYNYLRGHIDFADSFLKLVSSSYSLVSL